MNPKTKNSPITVDKLAKRKICLLHPKSVSVMGFLFGLGEVPTANALHCPFRTPSPEIMEGYMSEYHDFIKRCNEDIKAIKRINEEMKAELRKEDEDRFIRKAEWIANGGIII